MAPWAPPLIHMTATQRLEPNPPFSSVSLLSRSRRAWLACGIACTLLAPLGAHADKATAQAPLAEVALHQPDAGTGIRLKLHGVEDLTQARESEAPSSGLESATSAPDPLTLESAADEIKKQAQAKYLAAKLKKQESTVRKYVDLAWAEAYRRDWLKPELLIAIIQKESSFRAKVQSRYGAQGLMQVVRRWHGDKLHPSESLFDPEVNIRVGADVLEEYLELADGDLDRALRKYSGNARGYANTIKKESLTLARIAERAASRATLARG